ncbi:MAG: ribonuclease H-like domain-containing protein [Candidatus Helarchaeota archaeon]
MGKKTKREPKILLFDVENSPNTAYIWGLWQEVVSNEMIDKSWHMLCWAAKWLDKKKIYSSALVDFPETYKKNKEDDKEVLKKLWKFLDEADIVIAHNAKRFDVRKSNARFIMNGMTPPSNYKVIDTLQAARAYFFFTSNKLNNLGQYLKVGQKVETGGFKLWQDCMRGNKRAWSKMVRYCKNDVVLLEKIYKKLRPYIANHPNLSVYDEDNDLKCPKCSSKKLIKQGFVYTNVAKYQQYSCKDCGGWSRGRVNLKEIKVQAT